ncbi:unnamed protein product [Lymnaea stagnalis]|uniref:SH3 domain-containing protein n=1 Tax=Lymnaea stagnalis TaxID=6523 RepID=A0AAV2HPM2_LYMST
MVNTPIPHSLKSEAKKAAKILREFSMPNAKTGPDKLIPAGILAKAKGLAIITVFKAGFLVTARGGSGVVIAKLSEDIDSYDYAKGWSAPSAIALAGLGGGFEIGMEVTDFVIILNTRSAVEAFSKGGNLTLGGNFTIAAGPLGRNIEGDIAVRSPAAIYTYSKTKGIFAGISVEGSALIERKDANRKFYGQELRAHQILNGEVNPPEECRALYDVLREHQELAAQAAVKEVKRRATKYVEEFKEDSATEGSSRLTSESWRHVSKLGSPSSTKRKSSRSHSDFSLSGSAKAAEKKQSTSSSFNSHKDSWSGASSAAVQPKAHDPWAEMDSAAASTRVVGRKRSESFSVKADFSFTGPLPCDLSFHAGDVIKVTTSTSSQDDWWEGISKSGQQGIFPANYVHRI